ncbi:DUF3859 domain-containing protein [Oceanicoccus sp. KOV_DT_Chl]|uniref:DUF3859 domain-containing protein n=1 Tax=Oceanicoccus sp. KOV_DT_Chl TaxID=1904639 RepID=UPI000C79E8FC|nr:DUF3859 domain-containing protein [Oceanicoccus sp. KOV_DT_Chl]
MRFASSLVLRRILTLLLCLLSIGTAQAAIDAQIVFPITLQIKDFGIYQLLEKSESQFKADTTAGYASVVSSRLVKQTATVPLKQDQLFGFNFIIRDNTVDTEWVPVTIQIKHPSTNDYLGHQSKGFTKHSHARIKADGSYQNGAFYLLAKPYELVAGEWVISVIYRHEIVVSKTFQVQ